MAFWLENALSVVVGPTQARSFLESHFMLLTYVNFMACFPCPCRWAPPRVHLGLPGSQALLALTGCGPTPRPEGTILASLCPQTCSEQHWGCLCPAAVTGCPGHHLKALMGPCCCPHSCLGVAPLNATARHGGPSWAPLTSAPVPESYSEVAGDPSYWQKGK